MIALKNCKVLGRACFLAGLLTATVFSMMVQPVFAGEDKTGAGQASGNTPQKVEDPFESINRVTSGFNAALRQGIVDPLVDGYQAIAPEPVQETISNFVSNITEPVTIGSSLLQGDTENATNATKRFFINTTVGLGGTGDPATDMGLQQRKEDLGQAFGSSGVAPGPHLVLPIIGPTNFRDAAGDVLTAIVNPLPLAAKAATSGVSYSNNQEEIQALTSGALDPYIVERDSYEQNRRYEVSNGVAPLLDVPEFAEEDAKQKTTR